MSAAAAQGDDEQARLTDPSVRVHDTDKSIAVNRRFLLGAVAFGLGCLLVGFVIGVDIKTVQPSPPTPAAHPGDSGHVDNAHPAALPTSPSPPPPPASAPQANSPTQPGLDISHLLAAQAQALKEIEMLRSYYGAYAAKVLDGNDGLTFGFSGPNRGPTNPASFKRTSDVIARVLVHKEPLRLGFIGSSVMCGHDNCYYDSFPSQLGRLLNASFALAGVSVDLRNACQGGTCGDSYENQIFCMQHMIGNDVDFVHYEWTYFEQNIPDQYHELATRFALNLPKSPPMLIFNCDGTPWANSKAVNDKLAGAYAKYGANGISLVGGLMSSGVYKGKVWSAVGDGMHTTTRNGETESKARQDSLGVVFRNWHPGPLGLQYVADLAGYLYLHALVDAANRIKADANPTATWPKQPLPTVELPEPVVIREPNLLTLAKLEEPPGCLTLQKSTFGTSSVVIADKASDTLNPYHELVVPLGSGGHAWSQWVAGPNLDMIPRTERSMGAVCIAPDRCSYFVEPEVNKSTPLVFRLPKMTLGLIVLCGYGKDGGKMFAPLRAIQVEFDGTKLDSSQFVIFPQTKCAAVQMKFAGPVHDTNGHLYLSITWLSGSSKISQVIVA